MAERGASVLGVEVAPRMAEIARSHGIDVEISAFEDWEPSGRTFDRVTSAQAWHWLDLPVATTKAASVLRPGGRLGLIWNCGFPPDDLADALDEVYACALPDRVHTVFRGYGVNRSTDGRPDSPSELAAIAAVRDFDVPTETWFPWTLTYHRDEWLEQLLSRSDHTALEPVVQQEAPGEMRDTEHLDDDFVERSPAVTARGIGRSGMGDSPTGTGACLALVAARPVAVAEPTSPVASRRHAARYTTLSDITMCHRCRASSACRGGARRFGRGVDAGLGSNARIRVCRRTNSTGDLQPGTERIGLTQRLDEERRAIIAQTGDLSLAELRARPLTATDLSIGRIVKHLALPRIDGSNTSSSGWSFLNPGPPSIPTRLRTGPSVQRISTAARTSSTSTTSRASEVVSPPKHVHRSIRWRCAVVQQEAGQPPLAARARDRRDRTPLRAHRPDSRCLPTTSGALNEPLRVSGVAIQRDPPSRQRHVSRPCSPSHWPPVTPSSTLRSAALPRRAQVPARSRYRAP